MVDGQKAQLAHTEDLADIARRIRRHVVSMHAAARVSHVGCAFSIVDILTVLYFRSLRIDPCEPLAPERDRFILSKGHACSALYATLAERGFSSVQALSTYEMDGGVLPGHPDRKSIPGIEVSTGSLGHGLSIGVGMAIAGKQGGHPYRAFVLLSDGECDEGGVWEAAMSASQFKLDNLVAIVDANGLQGMGRIEQIMNLAPFADKWRAFGWAVQEMDGHDLSQLERVFATVPFERGRPSVVIAQTVKGKGVSYMEDQVAWHYKSPNPAELKTALKQLADPS